MIRISLIIYLIIISSCNKSPKSGKQSNETVINSISVEYTIQQEEYFPYGKGSIIIFIKEKTTEDQIIRIANNIRTSMGREKYNPLFIEYYLPGMKIGAGAYAVSHYNPDLQVNIMDYMLESNKPESDAERIAQIFGNLKSIESQRLIH